ECPAYSTMPGRVCHNQVPRWLALPQRRERGRPEPRLVVESARCGELGQAAVALRGVETAGQPHLHLIFRAEPHGVRVGLFARAGSVHRALVGRAVWQAEEVPGLVQTGLQHTAETPGEVLARVAVAVK